MIGFLFNPNGRIGRAAYGWTVAFNVTAQALAVWAYLWFGYWGERPEQVTLLVGPILGVLYWNWFVMTIKRLHDVGATAAWSLLALVGLGWIVTFILLVWRGQPGLNRFGPDPRSA